MSNLSFSNVSKLMITFLCLTHMALADRIFLKNGENLEGQIIRENDTHYVLEVQVTATIKDEKQIPKDEVKYLLRQKQDVAAYEELKQLLPTPDLLDIQDYESRIKQVDDFLKEFPASRKILDANKIREGLKEELEVVQKGGMKFEGEMISVEQYEANAYEYHRKILVNEIHGAIGQRNFLGALRMFTEYETNFPVTEANEGARRELVDRIKQVLAAYKLTLNNNLELLDSRLKKRELGLGRMSLEDRQKTLRAINERNENLRARFEREKAARVPWVTPDTYHKESLTEAIRQVDSELKRLETKSKQGPVKISLEKAYRDAWQKLPEAELEDKKMLLEQLKREQMPEAYLAKLRERAKLGE